MDGDGDGDGVINLSQRPSAANTPNGSIEYEQDSGQVSSQLWFMTFIILNEVYEEHHEVYAYSYQKHKTSLNFEIFVLMCAQFHVNRSNNCKK
jgi:hypothetical protein